MNIGIVYTSTTPELIVLIESTLSEYLGDCGEVTVRSYQNPEILSCVREAGEMTPESARRLLDLYETAAADGAKIILSACSSVGDFAEIAAKLYAMTDVRLIRIDEDMAAAVVQSAERIGVVATLSTTFGPTKRLLQNCAARIGKAIVLTEVLADGAFGLDQIALKQRLIDVCAVVRDQVDTFVLAQGTMAFAEQDISDALGMSVFSSIRFGVEAVADAVKSSLS